MTEHALNIEEFLLPGTSEATAAWYAALPERAQTSFELFEDEVVIVDTETTGFDEVHDSLIEIAACIVRGPEIISRFQTFVNPQRRIPQEIVELTGITDADVAQAPDPSLAVELFAEYADGRDLVAHNASFDRAFIMRQATPGAFSGTWMDSLALSRIILPRLRSHRLKDLAEAFGLSASTHRADADVEATAQLWRILVAGAYALPAGLAAYISGIMPVCDWPLRGIFARAAAAAPSADFSLRLHRANQVRAAAGSPRADAESVPVAFPSAEEITQAFSADGVAGRMYANYECRAEQLDMALEVGEALRNGTHCALEAGTGVGKSMAYLLPCALGACASGITVGVATKTNALMDQLIYTELPRLSAALGGLNYIALKGYEHYPCLRKLESMARDEEDGKPEVLEMVATLVAYTAQTPWGDLDAVNLHWAGLPRYTIEASAHDCLKRKCPYFPNRCFLHGARRQAASADIVVTNHALLFRDIQADNGILPPIHHWVLDEAHAVESEARRQLSHTVAARDLTTLLNRLCSSRNGTVGQIRRKATELEGGNMLFAITADIEERVERTSSIATSFFSFVKDLGESSPDANSSYDSLTLWVGPELRASAAWSMVQNPGHSLAKHLDELVKRLVDLTTMTEQFEELSSQQADIANAACNLREIMDALYLILDGEDESFVYSVDLNRATEKAVETLTAQRLDIGSALACDFYPNTSSVIYTSATLATGDATDAFKYFKHACGLDQLQPERVACRQLASSYDFDANMRILLPAGIAEPNARSYHQELGELLMEVHRAMGGSVLTLFTNRREMEELYRSLKPLLHAEGIELIAQTRGTSAKSLRDRFLAENTLSLFALKSYWEGFDAPGDTLRCVVIPKLPFSRPNDPLSQERTMREGRMAWGRYSLPEAVMDLKQAAGRLIRNSTDSGFLVLADGRLQTKNYGRVFLNAMPSSNINTVDIEEMARLMRESRTLPEKP